MPPPIYAKNLILLLKDIGGWEQQAIAKRLRVTGAAVSQWATGTRPVPLRHFNPLMDLVHTVVREHRDTRRADLTRYLLAWESELEVGMGRVSAAIRRGFEELKSDYSGTDPLTLSPDERRRLRKICWAMAHYFDQLDEVTHLSRADVEDGFDPETILSYTTNWFFDLWEQEEG